MCTDPGDGGSIPPRSNVYLIRQTGMPGIRAYGELAQLVEQRIDNPKIAGSNPALTTRLFLAREVVTVAVDWLAIRNDYINGGGSYRKLAERYGVPFGSLRSRAEKENWQELKKKQLHKISTKTAQKTAEAIANQEAKRVERLLSINDQLIDKIERAVAELDMAQVTNKTKTKVIEYKNKKRPDKPTKEIVQEHEEILSVASIVDRKGLQQIATALKTVWDIAGENEANKEDEIEDDGLLAALGANAQAVFGDGDDSGMLPKEKE